MKRRVGDARSKRIAIIGSAIALRPLLGQLAPSTMGRQVAIRTQQATTYMA